ncbi:MAG: hypothetical protein HUJ61_08415, partial [Bacilli bacterium]|nr:hypothetical protein [Bacilli bacterium]
MDEKKHHLASKKTIIFFEGLFLCIFSLVLIINVGIPAHALNFPFYYLFGLGTFLFFGFCYALGTYMIFARKIRLLKTAPHIIGSFLFFIASLILASFITIKCDANTKSIIECNVFSNVLDIFNNVEGGYLKINLIPLFTSKNPFGGGVVGYGILSLIYPLSEAVTITIITFVYLASLILIFIRSIIKLVNKIRNLKNNKSSEPTSKTKEKKKPKIDDIDLAEEDDLSNIRPIEDNLRANLIPGAISPVSFDDDFDDDLPFMGKNPATERSTFEKTAYFVNEDNKDDELKNFTNS